MLIGLFARRVTRTGLTLLFGAGIGGLLAFGIASMQGKYYLEIVLPGTLVGMLTGFATMRYGRRASPAPGMEA